MTRQGDVAPCKMKTGTSSSGQQRGTITSERSLKDEEVKSPTRTMIWTVVRGHWLFGNYGHEMSGVQRQIDTVRCMAMQMERDCALNRAGQRGRGHMVL